MRTTPLSGTRGMTGRLLATLILALVLCRIGLSTLPSAAADANPSQIATTFVALLAKGDFPGAETYLNPTMQAAAPEAKLQQVWQSLITQLGAFQRQAGLTQ